MAIWVSGWTWPSHNVLGSFSSLVSFQDAHAHQGSRHSCSLFPSEVDGIVTPKGVPHRGIILQKRCGLFSFGWNGFDASHPFGCNIIPLIMVLPKLPTSSSSHTVWGVLIVEYHQRPFVQPQAMNHFNVHNGPRPGSDATPVLLWRSWSLGKTTSSPKRPLRLSRPHSHTGFGIMYEVRLFNVLWS